VIDLASALAQRDARTPAPILLGWVTASTSAAVTVKFADGTTATVPKVRSYTSPTPDDVVIVLRHGGRFYCLGALNAAPVAQPAPQPEDQPPPAPSEHAQTFRPTFTGTWRGGWLGTTDDLYQGATGGGSRNYGAAYYGNGPSGLAGTAVSGSLRIRRAYGTGPNAARTPTLRALTEKTRPNAQPAYSLQIAGPALKPGEAATVALPVGWVVALLSGTVGGIGVGVEAADPYLRLDGRAAWAASMELTIRYRKAA